MRRGGLPAAVIDATLLSRLQAVELDALLALVFSRVHVPPAVRAEVGAGPGRARRRLRELFRQQPDFFVDCREEDPMVAELLRVDLDPGEAAVIAQAFEIDAIALIDERRGFERARRMEVAVLRSGALLCRLKDAGAIEAVSPWLDRLRKHGFYLSDLAREQILRSAREA